MKRTVFVYGTLKKGGGLHGHLERMKATFLGTATLKGVQLLKLGWYPGVVDGDGEVHGEVYSVPEEGIRTLDRIEGVPFLFTRENKTVKMEGDVDVDVETYFYARPTGQEEVVMSGKWTV